MWHIPDPLIDHWLLEDSQFVYNSVTLGTAFAQVVGYNPARVAVMLGSHSGVALTYAFSDNSNIGAQGQINLAIGALPFIGKFNDLGTFMQLPIWGKAASAGNNAGIIEVIWNQAKFIKYRSMIDEYFSKRSTS